MNWLKRLAAMLLAVSVVGWVLVASVVEPTRAATPSQFANVRQPIGVAGGISFKPPFAVGQSVWFVTHQCQGRNEPRNLDQIDQFGNTTIFATLNVASDPARQGCFEDYVASSPGLGSYGLRDANGDSNDTNDTARSYVYVTQGPKILEVPRAGCGSSLPPVCPRTFAIIPGSPGLINTRIGITFDGLSVTQAVFANDMLVVGTTTTGTGQVWRVRREIVNATCMSMVGVPAPCGIPTLLATLSGIRVGGDPTIVPTTFAKCPGGLGGVLVASETSSLGSVHCVRPNGTVIGPVGLWPGAGGVRFVVPTPFSCGPVGVSRAYVASIFKQNGNLTQFPRTDLISPPAVEGLEGMAALVTSRTGFGIGKLTPTSPLNLTAFQAAIGDHRGSDFCGREWGQIIVSPASGASQGKIQVLILSRPAIQTDPGFNPGVRINTSTCRFGKFGISTEAPPFNVVPSNTDANNDGIAELKMNFEFSLTGFAPSDNIHRGVISCLLFPRSPDEGFAGGE